jgi:hypothetical protein
LHDIIGKCRPHYRTGRRIHPALVLFDKLVECVLIPFNQA